MIERAWCVLGAVVALSALLASAEIFVRRFPVESDGRDHPEAWSRPALYTADADFGVGYRWEAFRLYAADRLGTALPAESQHDRRPLWAFFGNSFIQAPGMLADVVRQQATEVRVFNLGRNEHFALRLAQIKLLLANGLRPQRLFVALTPVDLLPLGYQPLHTLTVTAAGELTYAPRWPTGLLESVVRASRLAAAAWLRSGRQRGNPDFDPASLRWRIDPPLLADLAQLFAALARVATAHDVPVTVILIPVHEQIVEYAGFAFQDTLSPLLRGYGFDVFDPRAVFEREPDRQALYAPDKHLSARGNQLLARELLAHEGTHAAAPMAPP